MLAMEIKKIHVRIFSFLEHGGNLSCVSCKAREKKIINRQLFNVSQTYIKVTSSFVWKITDLACRKVYGKVFFDPFLI